MPRRFRQIFAVSLKLSVAAVSLCATVAEAQTVDEIIARNTEARGGQAAIDAVQSIRQTSTLVLPGAEATVIVYGKRPNLMRQELTIAVVASFAPARRAASGMPCVRSIVRRPWQRRTPGRPRMSLMRWSPSSR